MTFAAGARLTAAGLNAVTVQAVTSATHPGSPTVGEPIFETDTGFTAFWTGSTWAYVPQQLGTTTLGVAAASITVSVPSGCNAVLGVWGARGTAASAAINTGLRFNSDSGSNYLWQQVQTNNTTVTGANSGGATSVIQIGAAPAASATTSYYGCGDFSIPQAKGTLFKTVSGKSEAFTSTSNSYTGTYGGQWLSTASITSVSLVVAAGGGNLDVGSFLTLYGLA